MDIRAALKHLVEKKGSELFVTVGFPLALKVNNQICPISKSPLTTQQAAAAIKNALSEIENDKFIKHNESNCALDVEAVGRFRISAFNQKGEPGMVIRRIHTSIPLLSELGVPTHLAELVFMPKGLILMTGPAGSGKTTTLASLIDRRNSARSGHIIMIEDPIEYIHSHKKCIMTQRDVGLDTVSFEEGVKNALRQAPNIVVIGEIRSSKVMKQAMVCVETGHLCLATIHANNSYQAIDRMLHFFPPDQRAQLLMDLSLNIRAIVGQQLIESRDESSVHPAIEILLNSPLVADLIKNGKIDEIQEAIGKSRERGMQTFDQSLCDLYDAKKITYEKALLHATSANNLRLALKFKNSKPLNNEGLDFGSLTVSED